MKGSTIAGILVLGGMITGAVLGNLLSNGEIEAVKPRAARIPCEKATKESCPGGIFEQKDYCLCLTVAKTGELADEETSISAAKRTRLVVCKVNDPETGEHLVSRYEASALPLGKDCRLMADDLVLPGVSMNHIPTGIEEKLEAVCVPCKIGPGKWGPCPECAYRGDCDKLCKTETEGL